jgi:hypothetical protein
LCKELLLTDEYEVGVSSIIINQCWPTINTTFVTLGVYQNNILIPQYIKSEIVSSKYYSSVDEIIVQLNGICQSYYDSIVNVMQSIPHNIIDHNKTQSYPALFHSSPLSNTVRAKCGIIKYQLDSANHEYILSIKLSQQLFKILFGEITFREIKSKNLLIGNKIEKLNQFIIIVESDIVDHSLFGSDVRQVLALFKQSFENQNYLEQVIFNNIHYLPICKKQINSIKIKISSNESDFLEIKQGLFYITLHFRKCIHQNI